MAYLGHRDMLVLSLLKGKILGNEIRGANFSLKKYVRFSYITNYDCLRSLHEPGTSPALIGCQDGAHETPPQDIFP